jgi:CHAD domain-containing protein
MPPELTPTLLAEPAQQATRILASQRLAEVRASYDRFLAGEESGLHELRVALRRLRSWLRAYRPEVDDTLRKKTRRQLDKVAKATNAARDAEVALQWIAAQTDLSARDRAGVRYVVERLERERNEAERDMRATLENKLSKLIKSLSEQLESYWLRRSVSEPAAESRMAAVTRDVVVDHAERLARALGRIESPADFAGVHRARIATKRLRYLLETLNGDQGAAALVKKLAGLQDLLGAAHDSHRIANRLVRELGESAARNARRAALRATKIDDDETGVPSFAKTRPGLTTLAKRAHQNDREAYDAFRRTWRKRQVERTLVAVEMVAESLATAPDGPADL